MLCHEFSRVYWIGLALRLISCRSNRKWSGSSRENKLDSHEIIFSPSFFLFRVLIEWNFIFFGEMAFSESIENGNGFSNGVINMCRKFNRNVIRVVCEKCYFEFYLLFACSSYRHVSLIHILRFDLRPCCGVSYLEKL